MKSKTTLTFKKSTLTTLLTLLSINAYAENAVQWSGYLEAYYSENFNDPPNHKRPSFIFNHDTAQHPAINLAMVKAAFQSSQVRGNLALGSGTYMRSNYAAEPHRLRNIFEANAGIKLSDQHNIWLDVGVMPSHLGFESAIGLDNWTLTRSLMAEGSPYFETGAKISYSSADGKWTTSGLLLTGWQRIHRPDSNTTPSIGHQIVYKPNDKIIINSSSFIGNDQSDAQRQMRYFHDLYAQISLNDRWSLIAAFDIGAEQSKPSSDDYNVWFSPTVVVRYGYSEKLSFAGRFELFHDKRGVIVSTGTENGFQTTGYSINMDYKFTDFATLRTELKKMDSRDDVFEKDDSSLTDNNTILTTALVLRF